MKEKQKQREKLLEEIEIPSGVNVEIKMGEITISKGSIISKKKMPGQWRRKNRYMHALKDNANTCAPHTQRSSG